MNPGQAALGPAEEIPVSTLAVILIVVIAVLLAAMLILGGRRAATLRARRDLGPVDDDIEPYRSHAEASRRSSTRT
jgi:hypothetical protein